MNIRSLGLRCTKIQTMNLEAIVFSQSMQWCYLDLEVRYDTIVCI